MSSKKVFKAFVNEAAIWTNNGYGGLNIPAKIAVYEHRSVDLWQSFAMTSTEENDTPAILNQAHYACVNPSSKEDNPRLASAGLEYPKQLRVLAGAPLTLRCHEALRGRPAFCGVGASADINK